MTRALPSVLVRTRHALTSANAGAIKPAGAECAPRSQPALVYPDPDGVLTTEVQSGSSQSITTHVLGNTSRAIIRYVVKTSVIACV